ncbi:DUF2927 domain-containing protein [Roseovarius nanhaiticus]|uniref:Lipoprotein n=1 Tax=Roseovarius nanhaiticus TaxID=573024 RepID=A0A1N7G599_9RHOB|nr:DUF2927 domain-containing protein [Roseovarius nanhaiticus]SEK36796.1 Protein of unknown function [Roseovarius nanhaiticus]SIS07742.1 Protein of unknown function [Roseovarius nanhaiticus]
MRRGATARIWGGAAALAALAACTDMPAPPSTTPQARPAGLKPPEPAADPGPSERSRILAAHYARVETSLLAQGLLRTDGGGPDTPYTDTDLMRNFEAIAFHDEYARNRGLTPGDGRAGGLRKWASPVRIGVEFGASVPEAQHAPDRAMVRDYAARLARVTGHPISAGAGASANFNVLFMGEDDRDQAIDRIRELVPNINPASLDLIRTLPRPIHCLVIAFSGNNDDHTYRRAIALIRSEHPDLMRRSCVHEELAQGLGLANDSPRARPSIFNDDDEFALLTTQDEELLRLLYSPRLTPGMSFDIARPILTQLIAQRPRAGST